MATERPDLDIFLSAYPEVVNVFGVSTSVIKRWTENSHFGDFSEVLPKAKREFDKWLKQNVYAKKDNVEAEYARILEEHQAKFAERIAAICTFVGPKNHAQKMKDLAKLKEEFGMFPEDQMREVESDLVSKNVESWEDVPTGDNGCVLKEYFAKAIEQYGQDSAPSFDENIHLNTHFTGLVRNVIIYDKTKPGRWERIIECDAAYIRNGKICWMCKKKTVSGRSVDEVSFTWVDPINPNFKLIEIYKKSYGPDDVNRLSAWMRNAKFPITTDGKSGEIEVDYDGSTFYVKVDRDLSNFSSLKSFALRKGTPEFVLFHEALLNDPNFPSSIENIERLLPGKLS
ncbi:MAG: hypothetical protein WCT36_00440 [Candidatus Gracilibacteria bacterium]|jgi:hypothetical protein